MKIQIIETGEERHLDIIDPATGVNWIGDLMGNYDAAPEYDEGLDVHLMPLAEYEWWHDLTTNLEAAQDRYHELKGMHPWPNTVEAVATESIDNSDLEYYPRLLESFCGMLEGRMDAAKKLLDGIPYDADEDYENDHMAVHHAILNLEDLKTILAMPELERWAETYVWVKNKLECE